MKAMTNWQQQIEAQIADLYPEQFEQRESMQALLDVAVAADNAAPLIDDGYVGKQILDTALDKLREVG